MATGNSFFDGGIGLRPISKAALPGENAVDVIIVPAPWFMKARDWAFCTLADRGIISGNMNIYAFEPWPRINDSFTWKGLLKHGETLVDILKTRRPDPGGTPRPLILMAHSLMGFILKKFLVLIHAQREQYSAVRDSIRGVVLMGCPHASSERRDHMYKRALTILQLKADLSRATLKGLDSGDELTALCRQFDDMGGNLHILSLHEQAPTKVVSKGFMTKSVTQDVKLVDKVLSRVNCNKFEVNEGISTDHCELPSLRDESSGHDEEVIKTMQQMIQRALDSTRPKSVIQTMLSVRRRESSPAPPAVENSDVLDPLIEQFETPKPTPTALPCFEVDMSRQPNPSFFGRDNILSQLEAQLRTGRNVTILRGMGGLGKSEIALSFVHSHRKNFDAIFWIQADDLSKMRQQFGGLAATLGLEKDAQTDPFTSRELVKAWLKDPIKPALDGSGTSRAKWLIVFDGADKPGMLQEFESLCGQGSILITSRDDSVAATFQNVISQNGPNITSSVYEIPLSTFSLYEGADMLKRLLSMHTNDEDKIARKIVKRLNGWPLAITQMAGIIRGHCWTLTEFYEQYKDLSTQSELHVREEYGLETMVSSMRLALLSSSAMALLRVCAVLDPDCIQEELFSSASVETVTMNGFPKTQADFLVARRDLSSASLIQRNKDKAQLWMHRVVQDTVRGQCTKEELDQAFATAATLVKGVWLPPQESVRDNLKIWEPCKRYLRHILHLQRVHAKNSDTSSLGGSISPCEAFAYLLHEVSSFHRNLGHTPGLKSSLDLALSICHDLPPGSTLELMSDIYHSLGAWANETNHAEECMMYNKTYLDMRLEDEEKNGPNPRTAAAWNQYGTGLMMIRDYDEAMKAFRESIKLYAALPIDTPCPDSLAVVNLAVAKTLTGEFAEASELLEEGRIAREEAFGLGSADDSFRTGRFFHAAGNLCWEKKRYKLSSTWHTRALDQYTTSLGQRHHRTADVRHRVAMHCLQEGHYIKAGILIDQALESWNLDPGSFGQEIARTTWLKAKQQELSGVPTAASNLRKEAARLRQTLVLDSRDESQLTDEDFDDLVAFWSR